MIHYSSCPLCDSKDTGLFIQTNDFFLTREPYSIFRCSNCGFTFTQDHPDESQAGNYYASEEYLSHNDSSGGVTGTLYRLARRIMLGRKRKIAEIACGITRGKILDIGSGTGHFLAEMKRSGWETIGVEISEKARQYSASVHGLDVIDPGLIQFIPSSSCDCITLWHTLEHFQHPFRYAEEIHRILKPEGICIIALPNCSSHDALHYRKFWAAWDVPRHLWHFSPSTMGFFADKAGFMVKAVKSLPPDVFYISILSEKYRRKSLHFVRGFLWGSWFYLISFFDRRKSSSLIYIIQKKA
ncbi:MAG: class I SAM-dependent methyltransferase [Bacteroidales bacterium]|nr:class I SAM-dependent methyltransferase [Bacteroidales bacterium]